jgi:hypothetical protein
LNQNLKTCIYSFSQPKNQFDPVSMAAHPLTFVFFLIFHREAHHSTQSVRPFGPTQPTTPSFLSWPESPAPAQLANRPAQPTGPIFLDRLPPLVVSSYAATTLPHPGEVKPKRRVIPFKFAIKTPPPRLLFPLNSFETDGD